MKILHEITIFSYFDSLWLDLIKNITKEKPFYVFKDHIFTPFSKPTLG